jgi:hypothetical protein
MRLSPDVRGQTPDLAHKGPCGKNFGFLFVYDLFGFCFLIK